VAAQAGAAARAASTACSTMCGVASRAMLATSSVHGSRRSNGSPSASSTPPTQWGSGAASWARASASRASNSSSVSLPSAPLV
jgi:hypothetical protein